MNEAHKTEAGIMKAIIGLGHEVFLKAARSRVYRRGEVLFAEGDNADAIHIIKKGSVKLVKQDPSGRDRVLGIYGNGETIGVADVVRGGAHAACAVARSKVVTVKVSARVLQELHRQHASVAIAVSRDLAGSLLDLQRNVEHLSVGRAQERIAGLLIALSDKWSDDGQDVIPIGLTRQEIADMAGVTVETAIRTLSRFKRDGIVRQLPRKTIQLDLDALRTLAGAA